MNTNKHEYFRIPDRLTKLDTVLQSWKGTPFRKGGAHKGNRGGVDCIRFAIAVLQETGHFPDELDIPAYAIKHGGQPLARFWLEWVTKRKCGIEIQPTFTFDNIKPGDVILFHGMDVGNHVGICGLETPKFWHCLINYSVRLQDLRNDPYSRHIWRVWRPVDFRECHHTGGLR